MTIRAIELWALVVTLAQVASSSGNSIQWINPSPGTSLTPGQSVEAKWTSNTPIKDPSFSLCTADARCGQATPAKIVDNADGTTSALLSLPNVSGGGGMFLQMNDQDSGAIHQSPTFRLDSASSPKAMAETSGETHEGLASPGPAPRRSEEEQQPPEGEITGGAAEVDPGSFGQEGSAEASTTSMNPYKWDDPTSALAGPTATDYAEAVPSFTKEVASLTAGYPLPTSFEPSAMPTAFPSQWPFSNPYAALSLTAPVSATASASASVSAAAANGSTDTSRPNAAIIAVPLGICGAILLASLLFCARSRMKKQKDLETGGGGGSSGDWQAAIKRKALDAMVDKNPDGSGSVTITERRDDAIVPTLGYFAPSRQAAPPRRQSEQEQEPRRYQLQERYADDAYTRYDRTSSFDGRGGDSRKEGGWRQRLRDQTMDGYGYRYDRASGDRSTLSSRTGSGTRCLTPSRSRGYDAQENHLYRGGSYDRPIRRSDDPYSRHSRSTHGRGSRAHVRRDDEREYGYPHPHPHHRLRKDDYYNPSRRSRSGLGGVPLDDRCDCSSCLPAAPAPAAHRHGSGCVDCHRQESTSTRPRTTHTRRTYDDAELPGPTYSRSSASSAEPEPMIRTQTSSSSLRSHRRRHEEIDKAYNSHRAAELRRADTSMTTASEQGWDLAGKGAYETCHGRAMSELYESLRRAIGESEGGMDRVRSR